MSVINRCVSAVRGIDSSISDVSLVLRGLYCLVETLPQLLVMLKLKSLVSRGKGALPIRIVCNGKTTWFELTGKCQT